MGTNYYLRAQPPCPHCGRAYDARHIGKSSAGWVFGLHVDDDVKSLEDWARLFEEPGAVIEDEYRRTLTPAEMLAVITDRNGRGFDHVPLGHGTWKEFFAMNHAEPGPNGLLQRKIDGLSCIGHGAGTWDLCPGEFS